MALRDCMIARFNCSNTIAALTAEVARLKANPPRWSPFSGFQPIWQIGKRVEMQEVYSTWKAQMGTELTPDLTLQHGNRVPLFVAHSGDVMYALPHRIMQRILNNTRHVDNVPYDSKHAAGGDKRPEYDHDCKDYSVRFLGEFEVSPWELGYHMALVGWCSVPGHRRNIYLCDDMQWYMVDKTRMSQQWLANPGATKDRVSRLVI